MNSPPKTDNLSIWLEWLESLHIKNIDLSLERVHEVAMHLGICSLACPVITIAGTNGKGSTVATLEAIYLKQGYRVGAYTSPHLLCFNERIRINGESVKDSELVLAFQQIESLRRDVTLTFFEYTTLAGLILFKQSNLDIVLLEVGLGGRLDAVNIIDADVAVVTSIAIDHVDYLGDTREQIAFEKAGIFKPEKIAICGDFDPPVTLIEVAESHGCQFYLQGRDFHFASSENHWDWCFDKTLQLNQLPFSHLALQNVSTALMAYHCLQKQLPVTRENIDLAISEVWVKGRFESIQEKPLVIVDVAHNPAAALLLSEQIKVKLGSCSQVVAVFSALLDKDIVNIVRAVSKQIAKWYIAPVPTARSASADELYDKIRQGGGADIQVFGTITQAYEQAILSCRQSDCILVFGSFYTVAEVYSTHMSIYPNRKS